MAGFWAEVPTPGRVVTPLGSGGCVVTVTVGFGVTDLLVGFAAIVIVAAE